MKFDHQQVKNLAYWMDERENIRYRKEDGASRPWTSDKILQEFRFCNVNRENDRVTRWIKKHIRDPLSADSYVWWTMMICRQVNWPPSLEQIKPILLQGGEACPQKMVSILKEYRDDHYQKVFNSAYIVSTNGRSMDKLEYLGQLWSAAKIIMPAYPPSNSMEDMYNFLTSFNGIASFMAGQIISDLAYTETLEHAADWWTWCCSGPGSKRGLNRLMLRPLKASWPETEFRVAVNELRNMLGDDIHARDYQNCLCEFDKYSRVLNGEGKPRATYSSHKGTYTV